MLSSVKRYFEPLSEQFENLARRTLRSALCANDRLRTLSGSTYFVPPAFHPNDLLDLWSGKYELCERQLLKHPAAQNQRLIVEAGANIGVLASHAIKGNLAPGGSYVAIEANPTAHDALQNNLQNALYQTDGYTLGYKLQAAVTTQAQAGQSLHFAVRSRLGSSLVDARLPQKNDRLVAVKCVALGNILTQSLQKAQTDRAMLICDIEGAENALLREAVRNRKMGAPTAFDAVSTLLIELHGPRKTGDAAMTTGAQLAHLEKIGFTHRMQRGHCHLLTKSL